MSTKICRTCLSINADKDICQLPKDVGESKSCFEILLFCLDIQVTSDNEISTALCEKCYAKVILFYEFKTLALKNENYLRSLSQVPRCVNIPVHSLAQTMTQAQCGECNRNNALLENNIEIKHELEDKDSTDYHSNDELLNVIRDVKFENLSEETKENVSTVKKRKKSATENNKRSQCQENNGAISLQKRKKILKKPTTAKLYQCEYCDKTFSGYGGRKKHYKYEHLGMKEHCNICDKDVTRLASHNKAIHESHSLSIRCEFCDRGFLSKSALATHALIHLKEYPYKCELCDKSFRTKSSISDHKRGVHEKNKPFLCQICSKTYFKKFQLINHLRSHNEERPFACDECGKYFSSPAGLKNHKDIHRDVKDYICNHCGKAFTTRKYLRNHVATHMKVRKYPCNYCEMKFCRSDHRRVHERKAHQRHLLSGT